MKRLLTILFLLVSFAGISQSIIPRATAGNTVSDARLQAQLNFFVPRFSDTTQANSQRGIDSSGALIYTYDVDGMWQRSSSPSKHWTRVGTGQTTLPDGVYSGGLVAWTGTGLVFSVTPCMYVINGVLFQIPAGTVTLPAADPTFDRIDVIIVTSSGRDSSITGVPSANPQEPSVDPQLGFRRAAVTIPANSPTPAIATQIIYDQNLGTPSEWDVTTTGTGVQPGDNTYPYHLTLDIYAPALTNGQTITFTYNDTVNSGSRGNIMFPIRLVNAMNATQDYNISLYNGTTQVGQTLSARAHGLSPTFTTNYQLLVFPLNDFSSGNLVFTKIVVTAVSPSGNEPPTYLDYIQFQQGVVPVPLVADQRFGAPQGDNSAATDRIVNFNNNDFRLDNTKKIVFTIPEIQDSAFVIKRTLGSMMLSIDPLSSEVKVATFNSGDVFKVGTNQALLQNGFAFNFISNAYAEGYQQKLSLRKSYPFVGDSTVIEIVNNDTLNMAGIDTGYLKMLDIRLRSRTDNIVRSKFYVSGVGDVWAAHVPHTATADTFMVWKDKFYQGVTAAEARTLLGAASNPVNVGSGFRWVVAGTNNFKTAFVKNGILADSSSNTNGITFQVDSTVYATKAFVASVAGGGGFTGVTSVSGVNTNGISFSIATPTTTPQITLSTSVTTNQILFASSGAFTGSTNLTWDATNSRIQGRFTGTINTTAANTAPIRFGTGGVLMTTPQSQAIEATDTHIYWTNTAGTRFQIDQQAAAGVSFLQGTLNQVLVSANTGSIVLSTPQSIGTSSVVQFGRLTLGGSAATSPLTFVSNTDATGAAGQFYYNGTRLGFSPSTTIKRVILSNDAAPTAGQGLFGNGTDFTIGTYAAANNVMVVTPSGTGVTFALNSTFQTLTDGATITWNAANGFNARVTIGGTNRTLNITNPVNGTTYTIKITQDGTGSRTIGTWPSGTIWPSGTPPTLSTVAGAINVVALTYDGTNYIGAFNPNRYQ